MFPVRPGEPNFLAGTMGEMRGSHFHGGIDIRTGGRTGLPVYATADGYISRIQAGTGGYGHVLYLTHTDGLISVYGHMNLFEDEIEKFLRMKQYEEESYEIRLFPDRDQFYFQKGEIIGYSGNTGSSSGPHLHFEIRDQDHRFLNPQEFGYTEIKDNISPFVKSIAFVTRDGNARVNGAFGRFEFEIIKVEGKYTTRKPIALNGNIGVEIYHYDNLNGTYSRNGIPEVTFFIDDDTAFHQVKERMSFNQNRNILVHLDYPTYVWRKRRYNKLYLSDGNLLDIYKKTQRSNFFDENPHELKIVLRDNHNNFSEFQTTVNNRRIVYPETPLKTHFQIYENHLQFRSGDSTATVYHNYDKSGIKPYTSNKSWYYYLWDLRKALPDSIISGRTKIKPDLYVTIPPGFEFNFYNRDFDIETDGYTLFDTLYLRFEKGYDTLNNRELFQFKNRITPLRAEARVTLKPDSVYGDKSGVFTVSRSKLSYVESEKLENGSYEFEARDLLRYTIAYDTIPPVITPINWSRTNLKMKIEDSGSGIKKYNATINGRFLLMRYESKQDLLMAQPKDPNIPLSGEFILKVEDNLGNIAEIKRKL